MRRRSADAACHFGLTPRMVRAVLIADEAVLGNSPRQLAKREVKIGLLFWSMCSTQ